MKFKELLEEYISNLEKDYYSKKVVSKSQTTFLSNYICPKGRVHFRSASVMISEKHMKITYSFLSVSEGFRFAALIV
jgi:hypothetical protein